jgi:dihydrodipicolinate synthase/N-acetylneuraminate lyase
MKALMNLVGLAGGSVRPPLPELRAEDHAYLRSLLPQWQAVLQLA